VRTTAYAIFPDGARVALEIADTDAARVRGLMFRGELAEDRGMLFTFDVPRRYGFWMKNVPIPLDIIWLDASGRIVWIVHRAAPCDREPCPMYVPNRPASSVLEVAAGVADRHGLVVGARIAFERVEA